MSSQCAQINGQIMTTINVAKLSITNVVMVITNVQLYAIIIVNGHK